MKFEEVLPALRDGKKIRRSLWREDNYFYKTHEGKFVKKQGSSHTYYYNLASFLDSDDWEVVKETKKVKLRDLTEEQYNHWFEDNCKTYNNCRGCPFKKISCFKNSLNNWVNNKDLYSDKFLDQEIEIEEEE